VTDFIVVWRTTRTLVEADGVDEAWEAWTLRFPRQRALPERAEVRIRAATADELLEAGRSRPKPPVTLEMFDTKPFDKRVRHASGDVTMTGKVRRDHPDTAVEAAVAVAPSATRLRTEVLLHLRQHGPKTDEQMQDALGMNPNTQRPRRVELVERGLVGDSGERRPTRAGRKAIVWKAL